MKRFFRNILCKLSLHKWKLTFNNHPFQERTCQNCGKIESSMYDMSYGSTYWVEGKLWSKL